MACLSDNGLMSSTELDVVCLCAQWCGPCRDYVTTFADLRAAMPGQRYRWIDIEDEADAIGDIDVETFPTLLVAHKGVVLFAGPVLPRLTDAQRLLEAQVERWDSGNHRPISGLPDDQFEAFTELAQSL